MKRIKAFFHGLLKNVKYSSVELNLYELIEMESLFGLMVFGPAAGLPIVPGTISLELFPWLEHELLVLYSRARQAKDPWGELFSLFEVG